MSIVLVTGGFDPIHSGHIEYFKAAKLLGRKLIVGLNSDEWLSRKKGIPFMSWSERKSVIEQLKMVDEVIAFNDDNNTACDAIYKCITKYTNEKLIFANGGDRTDNSTPEFDVYGKTPWVKFAWGVGGDNKKNSSSWILDNWKAHKTLRPWGYYRVLDDKITVKVKELVINPGASLSNQKHNFRSEHWYIIKGSCEINTECDGIKNKVFLKQGNTFVISNGVWHLTSNPSDEPCHIIEVQYGYKCVEEDIERTL